jgi:hypothetical protein
MAKKKPTKADLEARAEMRKNNEILHQLALKARADLENRKQRER